MNNLNKLQIGLNLRHIKKNKNSQMKIVKLFCLFALAMSILSCKKDDPQDQIVGTWKASKGIYTNCTDPSENQTLTFSNGCYKEPLLGLSLCIDVVFKSDNNYTLTTNIEGLGTDIETGTYTINDTQLTLCPVGGSCETNNYTITDTTLNFKDKDAGTGCNTDFTMTKN